MIPGSATPLLLAQSGDAGYRIDRSLRFNSGDSAYLNRTPSSSGNRKTWTWSGWVKRSKLGADQQIWWVLTPGSPQLTDYIRFESDDTFRFFTYNNSAGSFVWQLHTSAKFRDPSSWYHIVCSIDTTQSTASDRAKLYINGYEVTDFSTSTYPSQNYDTNTNNTVSHNVAAYNANASFFDGYLADVHFIDGQALAATDFGEFDDNNVWQPIEYTFGTNPNNGTTWSNSVTSSTGSFYPGSGPSNLFNGSLGDGVDADTSDGSVTFTPASTITFSDKIRVYQVTSAVDFTLTDASNNTTTYSKTATAGGAWHTIATGGGTLKSLQCEPTASGYCNWRALEIDGFVLIDGTVDNSFNLDFSDNSSNAALGYDAAATQPALAPKGGMDVVTYTGNGTSQSITGLGFSPDFVWVKERSGVDSHCLSDTVRGDYWMLRSDLTNADSQYGNVGIHSLTSGGFSVGSGSAVNSNNETYVAWCWKAGGTAVSNTDGTITSSVSANTDYGFSIVSYTGTGATGGTVGHGLSSAPKFIVIKNRDRSIVWVCYHSGIGSGSYLQLNSTTAKTDDATYWGSGISSTTFGLQANNASGINYLNEDHIAYCWSEVSGFSKFGSYTGTGASNAITTGFKPRWILFKRTSGVDNWFVYDTARDSTNPNNAVLRPNLSDAELASSVGIDFNADGFSMSTSDSAINQSGETYIYAAFADRPGNDWDVNNLVAAVPNIQYGEDTSNSSFDSNSTSLTYDTTGFSYSNVTSPKTDTGQANASTVLKTSDGSSVSWTFSTDSTDRYIWTSSDGVNWSSPGTLYDTDSASQTVTSAWVAWAGGSNVSTLTITFASPNDIDSLIDTPTNYEAGSGNNGGNYATLNPLHSTSNTTLSNGNLDLSSGNNWGSCMSSIGFTGGKFYYETTVTASNYSYIGASLATHLPTDYPSQNGSWALLNDGNCYYDQTGSGAITVNTGTSVPAGAVVGTAIDADNGKIWWSVNGTWIGSGSPNPATGADAIFTNIPTDKALVACLDVYSNSASVNFGQRPFAYTPPTGYLSLCTQNLTDPTIADGSTAMDVALYTGNGSTQVIGGPVYSATADPGLTHADGVTGMFDGSLSTRGGAGTTDNSYKTLTDGASIPASTGIRIYWNGVGAGQRYIRINGTTELDDGSAQLTPGWSTQSSFSGTINKIEVKTAATGSWSLSAIEVDGTILIDGTGPGLNFQPDFVWLKSRNNNYDNELYDVVRGATKRLYSNATDTEATFTNGLTSFDSSGFTVGSRTNVNGSGSSMVAWSWDGGTSTVSNTDGSSTSSVRANASAGFSIVSYTGNATTGTTVGHGLNAAPEFIILKNRDQTYDWYVFGNAIDSTFDERLTLNSTAANTSSTSAMDATAPTSSVFTVGNNPGTNGNGDNQLAYCFAPVEGYSAFGSYTGNGSTDGPFVFTGFKPRWLMYKRTDAANSWQILDTERDSANVNNLVLIANLANAESTGTGNNDQFDMLSNGFKVRSSNFAGNASGGTYVYAAFASHPFKTARAR